MSKGVLGAPARKRWPPCRAVRRPAPLPASFRQGRCAARRPAVPDRRVRRGPVCARPDARPADHPGRRGPGTAPEDLSPARSPAVLARPAPSKSSPASREPIPRSTARCRRDHAAPDLPAEAGPRPVRHVSEDGRPLHSIGEPCIYRLAESSAADLQAILAGPPGEPIPSTRHASPRPYPHAPHSLLTMDPAAPPHRGRSGHTLHLSTLHKYTADLLIVTRAATRQAARKPL